MQQKAQILLMITSLTWQCDSGKFSAVFINYTCDFPSSRSPNRDDWTCPFAKHILKREQLVTKSTKKKFNLSATILSLKVGFFYYGDFVCLACCFVSPFIFAYSSCRKINTLLHILISFFFTVLSDVTVFVHLSWSNVCFILYCFPKPLNYNYYKFCHFFKHLSELGHFIFFLSFFSFFFFYIGLKIEQLGLMTGVYLGSNNCSFIHNFRHFAFATSSDFSQYQIKDNIVMISL